MKDTPEILPPAPPSLASRDALQGEALGRGAGLLPVLGFWMCLPLLTGGLLLLFADELPSGAAVFIFRVSTVSSLGWALVTVAVFRLTARFSIEHVEPLKRAVLLAAGGVVVALLVSAVSAAALLFMDPRPSEEIDATLGGGVARMFIPSLVIYAAVAAIGIARNATRRARAQREASIRLEAQLVEARLRVLHAQLNPHFLFNTLNAVSGLMDEDPRGARRMIARLSELLRYSLREDTGAEIPLSEELALVRRYLEIAEIRYQGSLETSIIADAEVEEALVPTLLLQPLAENAMKHGIARAGGLGRIDVHASRSGDRLVLTVLDTGADDSAEASGDGAYSDGVGLGLRHTRERLQQLYGTNQEFVLESRPGGGMAAVIKLPYHTTSTARPASQVTRT